MHNISESNQKGEKNMSDKQFMRETLVEGAHAFKADKMEIGRAHV